ncbi:MAG: neutral zinc metallopeptidase [Bauldia sp.]
MRWVGRRRSSNIEDRRGQAGGFGGGFPRMGGRLPGGFSTSRRAAGGLGIGALVIILVAGWALGIDPLALLGSLEGGTPLGQETGELGTPDDEGAAFVAFVLADTEDTWNEAFAAGGRRYEAPILVLFSGQTSSACGFASAASGPFYCPGDRKVYIDLDFYRELRDRFEAPGDFAEAYVIAHEIGHHVQNLLGVLPKVNAERQRVGQAAANDLSVRIELQADCLAGIWAHEADQKEILEVGDIDEGLNAAAQIGDDRLQKRSQGTVVPDSFTHGSAAQRSRWFRRGYEEGDLEACDTFAEDDI